MPAHHGFALCLFPLPITRWRSVTALQRTRLANERTFLTYVRTSLAMTGFGLALIQLRPVRGGALGYAAIAVAGVVLLIGWRRFRQRRREIEAC